MTGGFFYHENLLDNGENYEFYPVSVFPAPGQLQDAVVGAVALALLQPVVTPSLPGEVAVRRDIDEPATSGAPSAQQRRRHSVTRQPTDRTTSHVLAFAALDIPYIRDNWIDALGHVKGDEVTTVNVSVAGVCAGKKRT